MSILESGLEMGSALELVLVQIFVACLAGVATDVLCGITLGRSGCLLLALGGQGKLNYEQQQDCCITRHPLCRCFFPFQGGLLPRSKYFRQRCTQGETFARLTLKS